MTTQDRDIWLNAVQARTSKLAHPELRAAIAFLVDARRRDQGWGIYRGADTDRHASAVAVEALRHADDESLEGVLQEAQEFFLDKYGGNIRGLGAEALTDVIYLLKDTVRDRPDLLKAISRQVSAFLREAFAAPSTSTTRIAGLALACEAAGVLSAEERARLCERLLERQAADGSWSAATRGAGTVTASALAIRALSICDGEAYEAALSHGYRHLELAAQRLSETGEDVDSAVLAHALRALGEREQSDYWTIAALLDRLRERRNVDGGWAGQPDGPSTVEHTGLVVLAMTAAGSDQFVPARLARAAVLHVERGFDEVVGERDRLKSEFDAEVRRQFGTLAAERDRLEDRLAAAAKSDDRLEELERENAFLRRVARPVAYTSDLLRPPRRANAAWEILPLFVFIALVGGVIVALTLLDVLPIPTGGAAAAGAVSLLAALVVAAVALYVERRSRLFFESVASASDAARAQLQEVDLSEGAASDRIRSLRRAFISMSGDWPHGVRSEIVYLLFEQFVDVPTDIAERLAERNAMRVGAPPHVAFEFSEWVAAAALLEPPERRLLFDQLRRSVIE